MISRRLFLSAVATLPILASCKKEQRCPNCGMKLDMASPWRADLVLVAGGTLAFDTPRCALNAWRTGKTAASAIRVQEFYDRTWLDGETVRFVVGSDALGPMGADLVPVRPERAEKFTKDHGGHALVLADVTAQTLKDLA